MFGKNPIRPYEKSDGNKLKIQSIFRTLQGEGIYVGMPSIFIRLGGCNLACSFCDTEFEDYSEMQLNDILNEVERLKQNYNINLIVITGGEPFRQNIKKLCDDLLGRNFLIQIETNGTLFQDLDKRVQIVCSPKISANSYHKIRADIFERISAFKFLISTNIPFYDSVPDWNFENKIVYIQPMDEYDEHKNAKNTEYAIEFVMKNDYRLSIQTHKILNIE